jgi:hypothetical protein
LCVIDYKPRHPSQADLDVLRDLAALVENELNLLDTSEIKDSQLRDSEAILSATINTALDAIVQIDSAVLCLPTCVAFTIRACSPLT